MSVSSKNFMKWLSRSRELAFTKLRKKKTIIREKEKKQEQEGLPMETADLNNKKR